MSMMISMVMLNEDEPITPEGLTQAFGSLFPALETPTEIEGDGETLSFNVGSAMVVMARMPAPIPSGDLEGPCVTSLLWPDAESEVPKHKIHWIVTTSGEIAELQCAGVLSRVTAAVMEAAESCSGVFWTNSTMVIPKPIFRDFVVEILPMGPPSLIWVDFRVGSEAPNQSSGFTTGLAAFGLMEFEAKGCPEPPSELRDRLNGLVDYILEHGPVIKDGDTVGEDAHEKIRVIYGKSEFGIEGDVMKLVYETSSPEKPWWKLW